MNPHNIEYGMLLLNAVLYAAVLYFGIRRVRRAFAREKELGRELERERAQRTSLSHENERLKDENRRLQSEDEILLRMPMCADIRKRHIPNTKANMGTEPNGVSLKPSEAAEMTAEIDKQYNGFSRRLAFAYPNLRDRDITACCLMLLNIRQRGITALMGETYSSTYKRKHKLVGTFGTEDIYGFIETFAKLENPAT